ncbi:MAG: 2-enoyl thioester reductase domain-containing protein [Verrucomicrobiae bacterium]|nr:2-enoyl thioester reductase domain-containing protein [Verrucomicrobiae bacterium]NNJ85841.1 zinc-binding dehydrogenase [Akkermansiaceae bacterium]
MSISTTFASFGEPPEVIELTEQPTTELQSGEIKLRMLYAPINPADINYIQGIYGLKPELPARAGLEGCGEVIASESDAFKTGDLVITIQPVGTWSEEVMCADTDVLKIPHNTPVEQASMLKVNPLTAWCMLTQMIDLPENAWVIQNAANSGVGTCVIQIAKLLGLRTINLVRRQEPIDELYNLGADHVLLDNQESIEKIKEITSGCAPQLALNAVGGDSALRLMDTLATKGIHVTYGAMSRRSLKVPNKFLIFKRIQLHGFWVTEWMKENETPVVEQAYQQLAQWIIDGKLSQPVDSTYQLEEVVAAVTRSMQDKRDGKVLISCSK